MVNKGGVQFAKTITQQKHLNAKWEMSCTHLMVHRCHHLETLCFILQNYSFTIKHSFHYKIIRTIWHMAATFY